MSLSALANEFQPASMNVFEAKKLCVLKSIGHSVIDPAMNSSLLFPSNDLVGGWYSVDFRVEDCPHCQVITSH